MAFDWQDLLRFCLLVLKLPPQQIWTLTFREVLVCAQALYPRLATATRDELHILMAEFPDR
jgi:uncharacterized phage protein (TIGR02216 family)